VVNGLGCAERRYRPADGADGQESAFQPRATWPFASAWSSTLREHNPPFSALPAAVVNLAVVPAGVFLGGQAGIGSRLGWRRFRRLGAHEKSAQAKWRADLAPEPARVRRARRR